MCETGMGQRPTAWSLGEVKLRPRTGDVLPFSSDLLKELHFLGWTGGWQEWVGLRPPPGAHSLVTRHRPIFVVSWLRLTRADCPPVFTLTLNPSHLPSGPQVCSLSLSCTGHCTSSHLLRPTWSSLCFLTSWRRMPWSWIHCLGCYLCLQVMAQIRCLIFPHLPRSGPFWKLALGPAT